MWQQRAASGPQSTVSAGPTQQTWAPGTNPQPTLASSATYDVVSSPADLAEMVQELSRLPVNPPSLFMDLEGANLNRDGTLSILTINTQPKNHVYIVDITTHQTAANDLALGAGMTLRGILQSP